VVVVVVVDVVVNGDGDAIGCDETST